MKTSEKNRLIAVFMGWKIEKDIPEDYPEQEWHTTRNKEQGDWNSGQCVRLKGRQEEIDAKRKEIDEELWRSLCDNTYSRAGKYHISWDALMPVVEKCIRECRRLGVGTGQIIRALKTIEIISVHQAVVEFIKWYNEQQ